jgi:hypothetical protein
MNVDGMDGPGNGVDNGVCGGTTAAQAVAIMTMTRHKAPATMTDDDK